MKDHAVRLRVIAVVIVAVSAWLSAGATASAATDVMIVFDTTGSMGPALDEAKRQVNTVIGEVDRRFGDVRYGVASVGDYASRYGGTGDVPWDLRQPLTADRPAIAAAIDGLAAHGGGDNPEAYGRALMETDVNSSVGFRAGAQRLVVLVADDVPHDDDLNAGIDAGDQFRASPFDTGIDPGRDEQLNTADDIDWQRELADLRAHNLPLYFVLFKGNSALLPYWRTWAGSTGGSASTAEAGGLGDALVNSISAGADGCSRAYQRVGVLSVCADQIVAQPDGTSAATGGVRVAGGVDAGAGPVIIDQAAQTIASAGAGSLGVVRDGRTMPVAIGAFTIKTGGVKDDISGRERLAAVTIGVPALGSALMGGLGLSPLGKYYIDPADGGGVVFDASPLIKLFGQGPVGSLALGLHASSPSSFRVLGGSAGWKARFGPPRDPWELAMNLQYTGAEDTWTGEGEVKLPKVLPDVNASAVLRSGTIDSVGVGIKAGGAGVPLGSTGFFFDTFSGAVSGLASGPVKVTLGVTGGWGKQIPVVGKRPLSLEQAEVSVAQDYSGSVKSRIGIVDRRLAGGDLDVSMHLDPFRANGKMNADVALLGTGYFLRGAMDMTSEHFTATGDADFKVGRQRMQGTSAIISDEGTGASGKACRVCPTVGIGIRWRNVLKFPPKPEWIGAGIERYRTTFAAAAAAAGRTQRSIRVGRGTAVLAVYGDPSGTTPSDLELVAPGGREISLGHAGPLASVVRTDDGRMAITVLQPRAGTWRVVRNAGAVAEVQRVPPLGTIVARAAGPLGTRKRPLNAKRVVQVHWRIAGRLPAKAKVTLQGAGSSGGAGVAITSASARGTSLRIKASALRKGVNRLSLILSADGVPFRRIAVPGTVYRQ